MVKKLLLIPAVLTVAMVMSPATVNAQNVQITFCHATSSNPNSNNPYNQLTLPPQAIENAGHFGHDEVAVTSQAEYEQFKAQNQHWGDIIPPFGDFQGLNWTPVTEAILNNGCNFVDPTDPTDPGEPGRGGGDPTVFATSSTLQVDAPKVVRAGNGAVAGIAALLTVSVASIALGVRRLLASR